MRRSVPLRINIVAGFIHKDICSSMIASAQELAADLDVVIDTVVWVPGSLEIPLAVQTMIENDRPDAILVFGVQQKGKTHHGHVIAHQVTGILLDLQLKHKMPMAVAIIGPGATLRHARKKAHRTAQKALRSAVYMQGIIPKGVSL